MCMTSLLLLAPVPALCLFFASFFLLLLSVWPHLNSKQDVTGTETPQGHLATRLSDSCGAEVGGQLELPPLHEQRIIYSGFLMPTVKFSRSQFDLTSDWGGSSAFLLFLLRAIKSFTFSFVLREYLFLYHAAVISGAFWGLDGRRNGLLLVAQTARKILPSCMTSSLFSTLLLLLHVKVVFYCTSAPGNEHFC